MLIALIDDGVDVSIYPNLNIKFDLSVNKSGDIGNRNSADIILTDHGTTCARIIKKYAPEAEFCSLRIFHEPKLRASRDQLVASLEWCLDARIPIIHLSVGSSLLSDYYSIRSIVAKLLRQQQVIIAAQSNNSLYSIPASLGGVFRVIADKSLVDDEYKVSCDRIKVPALFASSSHRLVSPLSDCETITQNTNSYAAPTITAHVHNILQEYKPFSKSIGQIYKLLFGEGTVPQITKPDFIENAIIFNPSKFPVLKQHLFFRCVEEINDSREVLAYRKNGIGKSDLVYLEPANSFCNEEIERNVNGFENLLYGGVLLPRGSLKQYEGFVWNERDNEYLNTDYGDDKPIPDIPIVNIIGQDIKAVDLMCKLRDLFFENNYQCACLSDHAFTYLYNVEHKSEATNWSLAIENVLRLYCPDLLINCFYSETSIVEFKPEELFIFIGQEDMNGDSAHFTEKANKFYLVDPNEEEVKVLFNRIIEFFN